MSRNITITAGDVKIAAALADTPTADAVWAALPLTGEVNLWGDEIYFTIPVQAPLEADAREVVQSGDLGYWPTGAAFCIFFGPTPVSRPGEIRPASAVNVFGTFDADAAALRQVASGAAVAVAKADE